MYDNIGGKLKILAKVLAVIGAVASVIGGLVLVDINPIFGFLTIIWGPVVSFISSWLVYGFGELIENTQAIAHNTSALRKTSLAKEMEDKKLLENLTVWRDQNLITQEEYEAKKQDLTQENNNDDKQN